MNSLDALLKRDESALPSLSDAKEALLRRKPTSVVTHDSIDDLTLANYLEDSVSFRRMVEEAPRIAPDMPEPDPIDVTEASPDEIKKWQAEVKAAREAQADAPPYGAWDDLTADVYRSYHTHDSPEIIEDVDKSVELNKRIMPKIHSQDEFAESRNITRDDPTLAAMATAATLTTLREAVSEQLVEQAREAEEYEKLRKEAEAQQGQIEDIVGAVPGGDPNGTPEPGPGGTVQIAPGSGEGEPIKVPDHLQPKLEEAMAELDKLAAQAQKLDQSRTPMDMAALDALKGAAQAGQEAAQAGKNMPSFGAGFGAGEPTYTSPEQAYTIAKRWAEDPVLRQVCALYGRLDPDVRFKRSKRIEGGNDEIIDVRMGDDLRRTIPAEMSLLADSALEDDFLARYSEKELLEYQTVGEEHAGRGPMLLVLDGSGSMGGERNISARATAMVMLHIARLEKRTFGCVEFSSGGQLAEWLFPNNKPLDGEVVIDMASHMFGGGTTPIIGITRAAEIMKTAPTFKKADLVIIGDGEAGFGPEDERLRDQLTELGVRFFGVAIGGGFRDGSYLRKYCGDYVVDVHDFDLGGPNAATSALAVHLT